MRIFKIHKQKPIYQKMNPLLNIKLDDANYILSKGYASKENAEEYRDRWNNGGKRLTRLKLSERICYISGAGPFLAPYLIQID